MAFAVTIESDYKPYKFNDEEMSKYMEVEIKSDTSEATNSGKQGKLVPCEEFGLTFDDPESTGCVATGAGS